MKKFIAVLLICMLFSGCGQEKPQEKPSEDPEKPPVTSYYREDDYKTVDKTRLYGIAEPFWEKKENSQEYQVYGFDKKVCVAHMKALGTVTVRFMMPMDIFSKYAMYGPDDFEIALNQTIVAEFKDCLRLLKEAGICHIIGEVPVYPKPQGFSGGHWALTVPERGDEYYGDWCLLMTELWKTVTAAFPEIMYWEMGNETNQFSYLSPVDGKFSLIEQAAVNTDLMYYAAKGIRAGNPAAVPVTPGWTSLGTMTAYADTLTKQGYSIPLFLEQIYKNIASGDFPFGAHKSTTIDDYFQCIAYHPYEYYNWNGWVEGNERVFDIIERYDTVMRKVFFTEVGWPDEASQSIAAQNEIKIAQLYARAEKMTPVESVCYFRLYDCFYAAQWGGVSERTFGLFREPEDEGDEFIPKRIAYVAQEIFGGSGALL